MISFQKVFIFQPDGKLIVSTSGKVIYSTWTYLDANRSIIIENGDDVRMFHPTFSDDVLLVLQQDGSQESVVMIDESNASQFKPKTLQEIKAVNKPVFIVFNKVDAYTYEPYDTFSLTPKTSKNYTLDEFKDSWIAKENTPCIFISAKEKIGIEKLRSDLYKMVAEIHAGRYPFDNFLY